MKGYLHIFRTGLIAVAVSLACFGTAAPAAAEQAIKGNGGQVRMLYTEASTLSYLMYTFKKFALDKKYNIEIVPTVTASTATTIAAMQAGGGEIGNFGWNDIARYRAGGYAIVGITPWLRFGSDFYVVQTESPIKNLGDLKGKKIGTSSKVSLNQVLLKAETQKDFGVNIDTEAEVHEGGQPLLRGLLEQGQLDVAFMFNSNTPAMVATGKFRSLIKVSDLVSMYGLPDSSYLMNAVDGKYAATNPENVKAFVRAYQDAIQILMTNDEVWLERGRQLQQSDEISALFRTAARTDLMAKFQPDTEKNVRNLFAQFLPLAGKEAFGVDSLPDGFMTLAYQ